MNWEIDELESRARTQLSRMQDFSDRLGAIAVRETSPDGMVSIEVDGVGGVRGIELSPQAGRLGASRLGETIVATAALAAQRAFARRARITEEFTESFAELLGSRPR
ncbi:YbaB/EbfC family DNA-binding protein [Gordonia pseudamarae]|jgi:DNA-binding protein YbaB|uniref:YbaB/EbfC family DNA-binding protein n=1 Tax=Gordonia pseudamarae TaxID=2831662 RepID=A0ABX6ILR0_9ACTN|nr:MULTISPECIES: YbaB/EbfC family nucleoid-associated protein [Gordonia]MBD0022778.1 YbaB/EbfC family nucleoid-associated protein [Gordonia sp. (in: high G+C Gram-positive bacteria)]QHN27376.1 YbaB/EbfC family DNA-binding protein [Gordonia pseudamarae]QHN36260.1 YbaB/EbfC family DNA-binding protein [Gordonia pseudamarae]